MQLPDDYQLDSSDLGQYQTSVENFKLREKEMRGDTVTACSWHLVTWREISGWSVSALLSGGNGLYNTLNKLLTSGKIRSTFKDTLHS